MKAFVFGRGCPHPSIGGCVLPSLQVDRPWRYQCGRLRRNGHLCSGRRTTVGQEPSFGALLIGF
jgi:hypothetical protein